MSGNKISVKTLDLNQDFVEIALLISKTLINNSCGSTNFVSSETPKKFV